MKLTRMQKRVLKDLQGGGGFNTDSGSTSIQVVKSNFKVYNISHNTFRGLEFLDLIYQDPSNYFEFGLTESGRKLDIAAIELTNKICLIP